MKKYIAYTLFMVSLGFLLPIHVLAQGSPLEGPIITAIPLNESEIRFHDLGAGRIWRIETPISLYHFPYYSGITYPLWSSDGCYVVVRNKHSATWLMLNIIDLTLQPFSHSHNIVSQPLWHPQNTQVAFIDFNEDTNQSNIILFDYASDTDEILASRPGQTQLISWLSDTQLLFSTVDQWLILDIHTKGASVLNRQNPPSTTIFHQSHYAPDFSYLARHYDMNAYLRNRWQGYSDGLSDEEFEALNEEVAQSGFTLFELNTGRVIYIDIKGEFVDVLRWSPSSKHIVFSTHIGNVYIYDFAENTLAQLEGIIAHFDPEYGAYIPSWSFDEEVIIINTTEGYIVYDLAESTYTPLNDEHFIPVWLDQWSNAYREIFWSPIMDYQPVNCIT